MKYSAFIVFGVVGVALVATTSWADQVNDGAMVTFQANDTARADEVNANFDELKRAINDNASTKQNQLTQECPAGEAIRAVNSDGTVVCETDDNAGGDITSVSAGNHLVGGATEGDATLNVADMPHIEASNFGCRLVGGTVFTVDCTEEVSTTVANLRSVTVNAPAPGKVLVTFSGSASISHTNGTISNLCYEINDTEAPDVSAACSGIIGLFGTRNPSYRNLRIADSANTGFYVHTVHTQRTFDVAEGSNTYHLDAQASVDTGIAILTHELSATYFPLP